VVLITLLLPSSLSCKLLSELIFDASLLIGPPITWLPGAIEASLSEFVVSKREGSTALLTGASTFVWVSVRAGRELTGVDLTGTPTFEFVCLLLLAAKVVDLVLLAVVFTTLTFWDEVGLTVDFNVVVGLIVTVLITSNVFSGSGSSSCSGSCSSSSSSSRATSSSAKSSSFDEDVDFDTDFSTS